MATERLNDVWLIDAKWWQGCRELLLRDNCFYKAMALSHAFIFHFKCNSILYLAVCQLLCSAFLLYLSWLSDCPSGLSDCPSLVRLIVSLDYLIIPLLIFWLSFSWTFDCPSLDTKNSDQTRPYGRSNSKDLYNGGYLERVSGRGGLAEWYKAPSTGIVVDAGVR